MWCEQKPSFEITAFQRIVEAFRGDEVLVVNDTRVVPARFFGHKESGGRVEVLLNAWTDVISHVVWQTPQTRGKGGRT